MKIKKGDNVIMLNGKDRGKTAKVLATSPAHDQVVVQGLNLLKRHTKPRQQGQKGQVISKERPVHVASVAMVCPSCGKPTRLGFKIQGEQKVRICKKCKAEV